MTEIDRDEERLGKEMALALAGRICARATQQAVASCHLLELIGEFEAGGGLGYLPGVKSVAHWIAHFCSMSAGVAREHVRVARAMRRMPTITAAFRSGELSYSKVREVTRVVDLVDEARLCDLARAASASQLARAIAGYRTAAGTRIAQQELRRFRLINGTGNGMTRVNGQLPADESAIVAAALQRARDLNSTPPPKDPAGDGEATPTYADADALRDICQHYLNTAITDDESGEDRSLVIIQIAAEQLLDTEPGNVPAETPPVEPTHADRASATPPLIEPVRVEPVPAGTSLRTGLCTIRGIGGIEPETARRHLCTGTMLGAVVDAHGDVLALGRTRRLVSRAQRRALMVRDQTCQYPGCTSTRHLQAHHVIPWSTGGPTDLTNLILLCQLHHTCVHEGGIMITRNQEAPYQGAAAGGEPLWVFTMPDGQSVDRPGWPTPSAARLTYRLARLGSVDHVDRINHPAAATIQPKQYGERFDLHAAVQVLFNLQTPNQAA